MIKRTSLSRFLLVAATILALPVLATVASANEDGIYVGTVSGKSVSSKLHPTVTGSAKRCCCCTKVKIMPVTCPMK